MQNNYSTAIATINWASLVRQAKESEKVGIIVEESQKSEAAESRWKSLVVRLHTALALQERIQAQHLAHVALSQKFFPGTPRIAG